jgi:hypothetical protein
MMGSLARATFAMLIGLAAAGLAAGPAGAGEHDAYRPAAASPKAGPLWERPRSTRFSAVRCSAGAPPIDQLIINRDAAADTAGSATYSEATKDKGVQQGAGGWALSGDQLKVSGDGFQLEGRWVGAILTATITRPQGGTSVRCRFQVTALRSFTQYQ